MAKPSYEIYAKLRDERQLSDYRVMKDTGIPTSGLTRWKQGSVYPKVDKLQKLAEYFGTTMEYFLKEHQEE